MRTRERYSVDLDADGSRWLADEALRAFQSTRDYGWKEIAERLERQLRLYGEWDDDDA